MVCLHDQIFPSNFFCPPVSNKKVDKTKHLSISLPIFDGPIRHVWRHVHTMIRPVWRHVHTMIRHVWRHVHTIEIVFETCAQVKFEVNLTCMHTFNTVKVQYTKDLIYQYHHNLFVSFCDQFCMSSQHNIYSVISL